MSWLVFTYSLPSRNSSSARVSLWRRLKRVGAISPKSGVFILPDKEDCLESFQWLAQEIQQSQGEVMVMKVKSFEKLSEKQVIEYFHSARKNDYEELLPEAKTLLKESSKKKSQGLRDRMKKLRIAFTKINAVDFFHSPHSTKLKELLDRIDARLYPAIEGVPTLKKLRVRDYKGRLWVTRQHPYVDRLACAWLIRRFIDDKAIIRYSDEPADDEISFDMKDGLFGHRGNLCSFEVIMRSFSLDDDGVRALAEIVHEIDLRDSKYHRPEIDGLELALKGWRLMDIADMEMESRGLLYFDGLYKALSAGEKI